MNSKAPRLTLLAMGLSALLAGCRTKPAIVSAPKPDARVAEYVAEGDAHFLDSQLYGWRHAEASYQRAFDLAGSDEIRRKLLLTRFLIMIRQYEEDVPNPKADEVIQALCAVAVSEKDKALCRIAEWYKSKYGAGQREASASSQKEKAGPGPFNSEEAALEAYLYLLYAKASQLGDPPPDWEALSGKFKDSPLFLYLNLGKRGSPDAAEIEKSFPQFAEVFEFTGESLFQKKKYSSARAYFKKAIDLIPDYTRAIIGLGNIYFFALDDQEKALEHYQAALTWDATSTAALYGKGAALSQLGKYEESNAVLDQMLASDLSRSGRISASGIRYYQGEANYLKASNHHLMKNPSRARELVDTAKQFLPDSEEINYLSGILFFEAKDLEAARRDFLRVMERGNSNCSAQYHLGWIYRERKGTLEEQPTGKPNVPRGDGYDKLMKLLSQMPTSKELAEKRALNYFLGACSCMEMAMRSQREQINTVSSLDLEADEKVILKGKLEKRLFDYRLSSVSMIESMVQAVSGDEIAGKETYVNLMNEYLTRIRPR